MRLQEYHRSTAFFLGLPIFLESITRVICITIHANKNIIVAYHLFWFLPIFIEIIKHAINLHHNTHSENIAVAQPSILVLLIFLTTWKQIICNETCVNSQPKLIFGIKDNLLNNFCLMKLQV